MTAKIRGGTKLKNRLREIVRKVTGAKLVRVGFLENATYPDGTPVAMVAAIQNYGAPRAGIPARPFFSNMVDDKSPDWPDAAAQNLKATGYDAKKTLERMGEGIAGDLRQSIRDTNEPPLAESTLRRRGYQGAPYDPTNPATFGAKPLVHSGHMLASADYEVKV